MIYMLVIFCGGRMFFVKILLPLSTRRNSRLGRVRVARFRRSFSSPFSHFLYPPPAAVVLKAPILKKLSNIFSKTRLRLLSTESILSLKFQHTKCLYARGEPVKAEQGRREQFWLLPYIISISVSERILT